MSRKSKDPVRTTLLIASGIAGIIIVTAVILRILMAPLYEEMAMNSRSNAQGEVTRHQGGSSGGGTNVNVDLAGLPWLLNWAMGWAWGGPGWHNDGWGWNNWGGWNNNGRNWNGGGRSWNGNVNDTVNRTYNNINRSGGNNLERSVERNVERSGGGNIERNVERGVEHGGGGIERGGGRR